MIEICNAETYSRIKFKNILLQTFKIANELRQGDAMSSVLFNLVFESVIRKISQKESMIFRDGNIILIYTDNIVIKGRTQVKVKKSMMEIMRAGKSIGLRINMEKMKTMIMSRKIEMLTGITIGNNRIE